VLAIGLALLVLGLIAIMSRSSQEELGHNNVSAASALERTGSGTTRICQRSETIPEGTEAIRLSISSTGATGPSVAVSVAQGGRPVTSGRLAAGWSAAAATVPVRSVGRGVQGATVCARIGGEWPATVMGTRGTARRMRLDYLAAGTASWWSKLPTVVRRVGLNAAVRGPWAAGLASLLMLAVGGIVAIRLFRDFGPPTAPAPSSKLAADVSEPTSRWHAAARSLPATAWACALVAFLSATTWALVSPPFQFLDEQDHYAYLQTLAETGSPPISASRQFSTELRRGLALTHFQAVRYDSDDAPIWNSFERDRLDLELGRGPSRDDGKGAGTSTNQVPLYYLLAAGPYRAASSQPLLSRLLLGRLLSALFAAVTGLLVFAFVREALPSKPWAWTTAGFAAALQPLFGYASGALNPDSLLFALSAALFYCLARGFRRGLTPGLALVTGLVLAGGLLTKLSFIGLVPGGVAALLVIALHPRGRSKAERPARSLAIVAAAAAVPLLVGAAINSTVWDQPTLGAATVGSDLISPSGETPVGGIDRAFQVIWQLYLPRLPGMDHVFPIFPLKDAWIDGFVGSFGWLSIWPAQTVINLGLGLGIAMLLLFGLALAREGRRLRPRLLELASYLVMIVGLLVAVGVAQYSGSLMPGGSIVFFGQSRYLLPLLAPFAAVVALAARGAGSRWGPMVGVAVVILALAHSLYSLTLVISSYYA
jgi:hypothetical protein